MKEEKDPKKYKKPTHKLSPVNLVYIGSISGLLIVMVLVLIIIPNLNKNRTVNVYSGSSHSDSSSEGEFAQTVDDWFSKEVPGNNPIASSLSSSTARFPKPNSSTSSATPQQSSENSSAAASSQSTIEETHSSTMQSSQTPQTPQTPQAPQSSPQSTVTKPVENPDPPTETPDEDEIVYNKDGIVIVGTRAMSLYGANSNNFRLYAEAINKYKEALPDVNVYSMVIPTACEFYTPQSLAGMSASQLYHINLVKNNLKDVKYVDAYSALAEHSDENIYLKTDHHWAPLGGYYAAQAFAKEADVPFSPLSDYTEHVNKGYCGSMYGYAGNSEYLKNHPEDFVYYVPKNVNWSTTYINYKISGWDVVSADEPIKAAYFLDYGDNSSYNYCTFMAGDAKIVHVQTSTKNGRRLAVIKDSFGNAIPGYLFGSFEEIYVMDLRFFSHNMIDYLKEKQITDLLFANNTTIAGSKAMSDNLDTIRTQEDMGF